MPEIRRLWMIALAGCVVLLLGAALVLGNARLRCAASRLPESGTEVERLAACPAPVVVKFDRRGVPHLRADDERAVWFTLGYLHARDRFFQMELARRLAAGRLAELFGSAAFSTDRMLRTWRIVETSRRQLLQLDSAERLALEEYAAGVNAALDRHGRWISPELWILGTPPEPWRSEDSLKIGVLLQLAASRAMAAELERAVELARLGRDRAVDLWAWSPGEAHEWIPPGRSGAWPPRANEAIVETLGVVGANAWAVAGSRSATGRPLLANDIHLRVTAPGVWYAVHLSGPGLNVAGLSIPGAPGVIVGHTERVAWGVTTAMVDDQDLYEVTLDETGSRELIDGAWRSLRTVTERIRVRWEPEPRLVKIRLSERGPLVREGHHQVLALSWTGMRGPSPLVAVLGMSRARSVRELAAAWDGVVGPALTLVAADTYGSILVQTVGSAPRRGRGAGRLPAPGSDSDWAWRGFQVLAKRLVAVDPADGFVAAANHDPFAEGDVSAAFAVPGEYQPPWRVRRIRRALAGRDTWDVRGFVELQGDVRSELAVATLKQLWPELERHGGACAARLREWDGRMAAEGLAPHLFARLMREFADLIGGDEAEQNELDHNPWSESEVLRLLAGGMDERWWDDVRTDRREGRDEIVAMALDRVDRMAVRAAWGEVHGVSFTHPFVNLPVVGRLLGRSWSQGPFPLGGDAATLNATSWDRDRPWGVVAAPSARLVTDVGNWDAAVLVLATGQSGRPWSSHYADQVAGWLRPSEITLPFSERAVDQAAVAYLILEPASGGGPTAPPGE